MRSLRREKWDFVWSRNKEESKRLEGGFKSIFNAKTFISKFFDVLFSYIITLLIQEPLLASAHFIRTLEWEFELDLLSYIIFLTLLFGIIYFFFKISKTIRSRLIEKYEKERESFFLSFTSFIFAILFVDIFIEPLFAISHYFAHREIIFDLFDIIDRIIASLILLLVYLGIYAYKKAT